MLSNSSDGVMVWQSLYKTLCKKHVVAAYESHYLCGSHGRNSDYGGKTVLLKSSEDKNEEQIWNWQYLDKAVP